MKKLTYEDFLLKARQVHGYKYEYPNLEQNFVNMTTPIPIICHQKDENGIEHEDFKQRPNDHIRGKGCPICGNKNSHLKHRKNTEWFISKANEIHNNKYDYSKSKYEKSQVKVEIICHEKDSNGNEHGSFFQTPNSHLDGQGCPKCKNNSISKRLTLGKNNFITKSKEIHGNKFDYSKVDYVNNSTKVCIICPIHGEFWQRPNQHLRGKGCPKCVQKNRNLTKNEFIENSNIVHENKYDYSKVEYIDTKTKVCIICPEHGEFWKTPYRHLTGKGCQKCSWSETGNKQKLSKTEFIEKARKTHGDKYDYSKVNYIDSHTNVTIICPEHGEFEQQPGNHIYGQGCPVCNKGFTKSYVLRLIKDIDLEAMTDHQLIELISMKKLPQELKALSFTPAGSDERKNTIEHLKSVLEDSTTTDEETKEAIDKEIEELEKKEEQKLKNKNISTADNDNGEEELSEVNNTLPELALRQLHIYDDPRLTPSGDGERFIKQESIQILWNNTLKDEYKFINMLENEKGGEFFNAIRNEFLKEYEEVKNITVDENYKFQYLPNLMQKLMVYRIQSNPYYGNWCGTGAGKTIAMLLSSRKIDSKVTLCIVPNAVVDTMEKSIQETYPDSKILTPNKPSDIIELDGNCYNYIIVNYEKFQLANASEWINNIVNKNRIDFICLDEVQNAKVRNTENAPLRYNNIALLRKLAFDKNPNLKVLAMSATPIINNLQEVRSIMELITGKEYDEIKNKTSLSNVHEAYKALLMNGFRYIPKYDISINTEFVPIDGNDISDKLVNVKDNSIADVEKILAKKKIEGILKMGIINKGTLVYTQYVTGIVKTLKKSIASMGFKVDTYTGEESEDIRREIINRFTNGESDVLISSKPITTGVDGLQKCCNRMVIISLPWTNSDYVQLVGRIYRQGSEFKDVDIYIPQVIINTNETDWSWDKRRMSVIDTKKTLGEAVMDGNLQNVYNNDGFRTHLLSMAIKSLKNGLEDNLKQRKDIDVTMPDPNTTEKEHERRETIISEFNRRGKLTNSAKLHKELTQTPDDWLEYHKARHESMKTWNEIPYEFIASQIKNRNRIVADFGCGENLMRTFIPNNKVYSFDHVAIDDTVTACDMSHTPLNNETVDIAVFSLSLWGNNFEDYFKEAYRILAYDGLMYVAEPSKSYDNEQRNTLIETIKGNGFIQVGNLEDHGKFFYLTFMKK